MDEFNFFNTTNEDKKTEQKSEQKKLTKKQKIIIASVAGGIILLVVLLFCLKGCGNSKANNTYNLARTYAEKGEYDRAMSLLDSLLLKDGNNQEALALLDQIIAMKKDAEQNAGNNFNQNSNFTIDVDTSNITDGISSAMQDSLSSMKDALAQSNKQAEENRKAMENLIKLQEAQKENEKIRQQNELARIQKEKEIEAEKKAQEEQRKIQEEKRKAQEEELARKNAETKKLIDSINAEIQKGKTALATGNVDDALMYFKNAEKLLPGVGDKNFIAQKESEIAQALFDAATKEGLIPSEKERLMKESVVIAEKAIVQNPKDAPSHFILAQNAMDKKDWNTALAEMNKAISGDPNNYLYYYNLGKIQYSLKKYAEAASSFTTSCELKSDFAPSRYNLGLTQKKLNNDAAALEAFRKTIDIEPRHEKAYLEQARILDKRGDYSGSIDAYKNVIAINNTNEAALLELGSVYTKKQLYKDAEDAYIRALANITNQENIVLTKYNLSTVLFAQNKMNDSVKYAKEAYNDMSKIKNNKTKANIVYNYALLLDTTGKTDEAISKYMEVLDLNSEHLKTRINLGVMYMNLVPPDVDTALGLFTYVYNKEQNNFEANNNLGTAYLRKEDYTNAILYYKNALKLDSKNNEVRSNLARAYAKNGDYDLAKVTYTDLLRENKEDWDAYIELAKVCIQLSDNESAEKYLIFVQEKNPAYKADEINSLLQSISQ